VTDVFTILALSLIVCLNCSCYMGRANTAQWTAHLIYVAVKRSPAGTSYLHLTNLMELKHL